MHHDHINRNHRSISGCNGTRNILCFEEEGKLMRKAIIPVELSVLEEMFMLPANFKLEALWTGDEQTRVNFLVSSDALPDTEGNHLPEIDLHCTVQNHPDHPDFKRITARDPGCPALLRRG
jgi:hypothetical protein